MYWSQGWRYLVDLVVPYVLLVPLVVIVGVLVIALRTRVHEHGRDLVVFLALPVAGVAHALFKRAEMIEAGWALIQPILNAWGAGRGGELHPYAAGSDGPIAADEMIRRDGRAWRAL